MRPNTGTGRIYIAQLELSFSCYDLGNTLIFSISPFIMIPFHYFNHLVFIQRKMSLAPLVINTNTGTVMLVRKTTLNLFWTVREWKHISVVSESPPSGRFCLVQGLQYPDCYSSLCINTAWKQIFSSARLVLAVTWSAGAGRPEQRRLGGMWGADWAGWTDLRSSQPSPAWLTTNGYYWQGRLRLRLLLKRLDSNLV